MLLGEETSRMSMTSSVAGRNLRVKDSMSQRAKMKRISIVAFSGEKG